MFGEEWREKAVMENRCKAWRLKISEVSKIFFLAMQEDEVVFLGGKGAVGMGSLPHFIHEN